MTAETMMNVQEKQAWYVLAVFGVALVTYLAVACFLGFHPRVLGVFDLLGLAGFTPLIGRRERRAGKVVMDERDTDIARKAYLAAYSLFWLCFVAVCMAPFFAKGPNATLTIPTILPPMLLMGGGALIAIVYSLVVIAMYRR